MPLRGGISGMSRAVAIRAIASPLKAPSTAPISMARAVPIPCAAAPSANPLLRHPARRSGARDPTRRRCCRKFPRRKPPPMSPTRCRVQRSETDTAIGTVTDFGGRRSVSGVRYRTSWRYKPRSAPCDASDEGGVPTGSRLPAQAFQPFAVSIPAPRPTSEGRD